MAYNDHCLAAERLAPHPGRFYASSVASMRRILIDHARARGRQERGGNLKMLSLDLVTAAADALGISQRTAQRECTFARAWLYDALN